MIEADARAGRVPLELDGEPLGALPARFEVLPGALAWSGRRVSDVFARIRARAARGSPARALRAHRRGGPAALGRRASREPPRPRRALDPAHRHFARPRHDARLRASRSTRSTSARAGSRSCASGPGRSGYFTIATCAARALRARRAPLGARRCCAARRRRAARASSARRAQRAGVARADGAVRARAARSRRACSTRATADRFAARGRRPPAGSAERLVELLARDAAATATSRATRASRCRSTSARRSRPRISRRLRRARAAAASRDLDRLTIFADNLVPHVLRREGVLVYDAGAAARIERGRAARPRARPRRWRSAPCALHAVELRRVSALRARGVDASAQRARLSALESRPAAGDQGASAPPHAVRSTIDAERSWPRDDACSTARCSS